MQSLDYAAADCNKGSGSVKWSYFIERNCVYQGRITLKGVEWQEEEVEIERERNYRGKEGERIQERELLEERM